MIENVVPADHHLGFRSLEDERTIDPLPLDGRPPEWLRGTLHRVGPAKFEVGGRPLNHMFDGLSMIHRFTFTARGVSYSNRFLDSRAYRAARDTGRLAYQEFATVPDRGLRERVSSAFMASATDNANVALAHLGGGLIAQSVAPRPLRLDPASLEVRGALPRAPFEVSTAYPHYDRGGEILYFALRIRPRPSYHLYARDASGAVREIGRLAASRPTYLSSFAITERHAILAESPYMFSPMEMIFAGRPYHETFRWLRDRPAWFHVLDRRTGEVRARLEAEPFFSWHNVNAFEQGSEIVVDLIAYPDADVVSRFYLERLRAGVRIPLPELRRYRLPLDGSGADFEALATGFEMPRIDYAARNGRPYRHLYGSRYGTDTYIDAVQKADLESGETLGWAETGACPDSVCFIPRPGGRSEDDGVLATALLEPARGASSLLILDARDLSELCRARLPHHLPYGLGGDVFTPTGAT